MDENGASTEEVRAEACRQCGHLFDPHAVIPTGETPTDGGIIICQVKDCLCYSTWDVPQLGGTRSKVLEPSEIELAHMRRQLQSEEP